MYGRNYGERELTFEPSGGLLHAALVMQDKETDSYWPIMTGKSASGSFKGTSLDEWPVGEKSTWKDWRDAHPETLVLSVDGVEHIENNPYDNYFTSSDGFRKMAAEDDRLETKAPIYSFQLSGAAYAVPFDAFTDGGSFEADGVPVFVYRPKDVAIFYSSIAYRAGDGSFVKQKERWTHQPSGAVFDPAEGRFVGKLEGVERLEGFDTFWYMWSLTHPESRILE